MWTKLGTIRVRLTLWYVLFLAGTLIAFSYYLHYELQASLALQIDAGLQAAASHLFVDVDESADPPTLNPRSDTTENYLVQSSFALRLVDETGAVAADVGHFPALAFAEPTSGENFKTVMIGDVPWRIYTARVETQSNQPSEIWLQMGQSLDIIEETQQSLFTLILIGLPVTLVAAGFGGMFVANRALHQVDTITRTVQTINATDMTRRIQYSGSQDEMGRLIETLNSMLERLQAAFEAQRRFTADASHELRTPLTIIKGHIGVTLTRPRTSEEYAETLHQIQGETDRLIRLTNDLLFLARLDAAPLHWQAEPIHLSDLLAAVLDPLEALADEKQITLHTTIAPGLELTGKADHLIRLYLNVLDNAVKYTPVGGTIHVSAQASDQHIEVVIHNSGAGIAPEHLPHLFKRFYRGGREQTEGAGLGLPIASQIVQEHGGTLTIESHLGTTVTIRLPTQK